MGGTFVERVLAAKAGLGDVGPGQIVEVDPEVALSHDNTAAIIEVFRQIGAERLAHPEAHVIVLDHGSPAPTTKHAENHKAIREFVAREGIEHFYDVGRGVCHQVLAEEGFALPGKLILGADSHTMTAGAFGALAVGVGRSEMASCMATGSIWLRVPDSLKIVVNGTLSEGVTAKDLVLHVIGDLRADGALYMSVEWHGEAVRALGVDGAMTLCNMSAEMGAKNAYVPPGPQTLDWLEGRARDRFEPVYPDEDAEYSRTVEYEAGAVVPMVAKPHTVDNVAPLSEVAGTPIHQAFLGACTNGRASDLRVAADVLDGRSVAPFTRLIVIPASSEVYLDALESGSVRTLVEAGAVVGNPGCGPCMGNHMGIPARGEVTISSANRNFQGRMGTQDSEVYLASPLVVAASAALGRIAHPEDLKR
jgi:3-isopropylmalate dehydratase large subunit